MLPVLGQLDGGFKVSVGLFSDLTSCSKSLVRAIAPREVSRSVQPDTRLPKVEPKAIRVRSARDGLIARRDGVLTENIGQ